jgi:hypothetical protein
MVGCTWPIFNTCLSNNWLILKISSTKIFSNFIYFSFTSILGSLKKIIFILIISTNNVISVKYYHNEDTTTICKQSSFIVCLMFKYFGMLVGANQFFKTSK